MKRPPKPAQRQQEPPASIYGNSITLDITRPYEILAICPECGNRRNLPEDWRRIVAPTMPPDWDGTIQCHNGHQQQPMYLIPIRNPQPPQPDGTYLVHLVMDEDHRRAACTGQLWAGLPDNPPPGSRMRLCDACHHHMLRSG